MICAWASRDIVLHDSLPNVYIASECFFFRETFVTGRIFRLVSVPLCSRADRGTALPNYFLEFLTERAPCVFGNRLHVSLSHYAQELIAAPRFLTTSWHFLWSMGHVFLATDYMAKRRNTHRRYESLFHFITSRIETLQTSRFAKAKLHFVICLEGL